MMPNALLLCRGDTLLDDDRAALAAESQARDVDTGLQAIVERRYEVAATCVGRKPANMQFAVRRVAADTVGAIRNGADEARARRAVAHQILLPGSLFAAPDVDAVIDARHLFVAGGDAAIDEGDLDSSPARFSRELIEPHRDAAPIQRIGQR